MASKESISSGTVTLAKISDALEAIDEKKEKLRVALEHLQAHSSSLASFTLQWKDFEDHFNSVQKSLEERFKGLEAREKQKNGQNLVVIEPVREVKKPSPVKEPEEDSKEFISPELKALCVRMDGIGLRSYIMDCRQEPRKARDEVSAALNCAPDAAKLVLDAMPGFYPSNKRGNGVEVGAIRKTCVLLLEELLVISPEIKAPVKMEAKKLALEWKKEVKTESNDQLEALPFLLCLAIYGLASEFDANEILDLLVSVARRKQAVDMARALNIKEKIPELVQKLCTIGKQLDAVKFVYAFELVDKFPPVPLLKAYLKESKKVAQEVRKKGNNSLQSQNEAIAKETAHLRSMIKCIEEHKLESQFSREGLDKRIEQLEKQKADRKRPAAVLASAPKPQQKKQKHKHNQTPQQLSGNKRPRPVSSHTADVALPSIASGLQMHPRYPSGLMSDQVSPYLSSSAHYSLPGAVPGAANYSLAGIAPNVSNISLAGTASSIAPHGLPGAAADGAQYLNRPHLASGLYDRSVDFGGTSHLFPSYGSYFYR